MNGYASILLQTGIDVFENAAQAGDFAIVVARFLQQQRGEASQFAELFAGKAFLQWRNVVCRGIVNAFEESGIVNLDFFSGSKINQFVQAFVNQVSFLFVLGQVVNVFLCGCRQQGGNGLRNKIVPKGLSGVVRRFYFVAGFLKSAGDAGIKRIVHGENQLNGTLAAQNCQQAFFLHQVAVEVALYERRFEKSLNKFVILYDTEYDDRRILNFGGRKVQQV